MNKVFLAYLPLSGAMFLGHEESTPKNRPEASEPSELWPGQLVSSDRLWANVTGPGCCFGKGDESWNTSSEIISFKPYLLTKERVGSETQTSYIICRAQCKVKT